MDSSDASNVYITDLDEATIYFFGWTKIPQESAKARQTRKPTVQNIPDAPIFRSTTCPLLP
jgi:hypothetical protein